MCCYTLLRYNRIKHRLKQEAFLALPRYAVKHIIRLRAGTQRLRVVTGRHRGMHRALRMCRVCGCGQVEDVDHYLEHCVALEDCRGSFWNDLFAMMHIHMRQRLSQLSITQRVDWLLGTEPICNSYKWPLLQKTILKGLADLWKFRAKILIN